MARIYRNGNTIYKRILLNKTFSIISNIGIAADIQMKIIQNLHTYMINS